MSEQPKDAARNAVTPATEAEKAAIAEDLRRVKGYFPFRIVWGYLDPETRCPVVGANVTKRQMNDAIRAGREVFTLDSKP